MDYKSLLASIYSPDIGSLWCVSDGIWETGFAANKSSSDFHPALVGKIEPTGSSCRLIPGTSQEFKKGSCVFKTVINPNISHPKTSHFLIQLWMTVNNSDLFMMKRGWSGVDQLDENQLRLMFLQIKFCTGQDVQN